MNRLRILGIIFGTFFCSASITNLALCVSSPKEDKSPIVEEYKSTRDKQDYLLDGIGTGVAGLFGFYTAYKVRDKKLDE